MRLAERRSILARNRWGIWTQASRENVASGGNLLANDTVPGAIVDAYLSTTGHIGDRLIAAMLGGAGGRGRGGAGAFCGPEDC